MSVVKNINYKVGNFELNIPRFEIVNKGITLLVGESGSGKSTLVDLLVGFRSCREMSWQWNELNYSDLSIEEKQIGLVLQGGFVFPHLTFKECVSFAATARKRKESEWGPELNNYLQALHLQPSILKQKSSKLSGGERQRLALICAFIGQPKFLLLDEPFSALDHENKERSVKLLNNFTEVHGVPALVITHNQSSSLKVSSRIEISHGKLV